MGRAKNVNRCKDVLLPYAGSPGEAMLKSQLRGLHGVAECGHGTSLHAPGLSRYALISAAYVYFLVTAIYFLVWTRPGSEESLHGGCLPLARGNLL